MEYQEHWLSTLNRARCCELIAADVESVSVFRFVSKLSGGGVIVRVLQAPETDRPFWGKIQENRIRIVQNIPSQNISPYQPIVYLELEEAEKGTEISVLMKPHKDASMFALFEWMGAILCVTAGLIALSQSPLAGVTIVFGLALGVFPWFRSRKLFAFEKNRCLEGLNGLKSKLEAQELEISEKMG